MPFRASRDRKGASESFQPSASGNGFGNAHGQQREESRFSKCDPDNDDQCRSTRIIVGRRRISEQLGYERKCQGCHRTHLHTGISERLDAWVPFKALDVDVIKLIVEKFINELNGQLAEKRVLVRLIRSGASMACKEWFRCPIWRTADGAADTREDKSSRWRTRYCSVNLQAAAALSSKRTTTNCY